jgi:hypothetical protein
MYGQRVNTDMHQISETLSIHVLSQLLTLTKTHPRSKHMQNIVKRPEKLENGVDYVIPWPRGHNVNLFTKWIA